MKSTMLNFSIFLYSLTLITSCSNRADATFSVTDSVTSITIEKGSSAKSVEITDSLKSNFYLLQGKWQSTDDKTNFIIFENNQRKEIATVMNDLVVETFSLSDKCTNQSDTYNHLPSEKDKYLSLIKSDLCYYIIELNATNLSLSFMGRGNTLNYTRVK